MQLDVAVEEDDREPPAEKTMKAAMNRDMEKRATARLVASELQESTKVRLQCADLDQKLMVGLFSKVLPCDLVQPGSVLGHRQPLRKPVSRLQERFRSLIKVGSHHIMEKDTKSPRTENATETNEKMTEEPRLKPTDEIGLVLETSEDLEIFPTFQSMNLKEPLLRGIYGHGYDKPSPIQQRAVVPIVKGRDVIVQSQAGTGKTAVFCIGSLQILVVTSN